jgi:ribosomal protein S12 methylthiotransferase accessory factor
MPGAPDAGLKGYRHGTHRTIAPAATLDYLSHLCGAMGITRVANITGLDHVGLPVVIACRPNSRSLAVSQGKGIDLASAKVSGIMESIEQYHAERISLPLRLGSFNELRHVCRTVPVELLPCSTVSRYHPALRLLWIEGYDLIHERTALIPFELVHLNLTLPLPEGSGCFPLSSNGLASGNHVLEAVVHGACEVIERDAATLWMLSEDHEKAATRVALDSVDDAQCRNVLELFARANLLAAVWDMTSDLGIPAFRCTIMDRAQDPLRPLYPATGSGCHTAREVALLRALTEAAQGRLTVIAGSRDDIPRTEYALAHNSEELQRLRSSLVSEPGIRRFSDVATSVHPTFEDDIAWIIERLRHAASAGLLPAEPDGPSLIAVDLSIRGLRIAVVRVLIPGLEQQRMGMDYMPGLRARGRLNRRQHPPRQ